MKNKILFVSISAPPKNAPESLQAAKYIKYLSKNNEITLVTSDIAGGWRPQDNTLSDYLDNIYRVITFPIWNNKYYYHFIKRFMSSLLQKPDEDAPFYWKYKQVLKELKDYSPDIIYSRSAPLSSHFLAYRLKKWFKKPWVMHLSDPWVDNPYSGFKGSILKFHKKWEGIFFNEATKITFTSDKTVDFYKAKYPELAAKFELCLNVYDKEEVEEVPIDLSQKLTIVHTGRLYGSRSGIPLLAAIKSFLNQVPEAVNKVEFIFAGFCDEANIKAFKESSYKAVKYLGPVSFTTSLELQRKAHILVVIDGNEQNKLFNLFFPSKILDYIIAKRRILALTTKDSTTDELVKDQYGNCFRHDDTIGISNFLKEAYQQYLNNNEAWFLTDEIPVEYSAEYNADKLNSIFNALV